MDTSGCSWVTALNLDYFPTLAVAMPVDQANEFVQYTTGALAAQVHDDEAMLGYIRKAGLRTLLSVSSAVGHRQVKSVIGNRARKAACFRQHEATRNNELLAHSFPFCPYFAGGTAQCLVPSKTARAIHGKLCTGVAL
jgi:hypothetical protein